MSLFHSILSQLQQKISKETTSNETIAHIISTVIGTTVTKEQITVQDTTVRIKTSPTVKMAVTLRREKILAALQQAEIPVITIE